MLSELLDVLHWRQGLQIVHHVVAVTPHQYQCFSCQLGTVSWSWTWTKLKAICSWWCRVLQLSKGKWENCCLWFLWIVTAHLKARNSSLWAGYLDSLLVRLLHRPQLYFSPCAPDGGPVELASVWSTLGFLGSANANTGVEVNFLRIMSMPVDILGSIIFQRVP